MALRVVALVAWQLLMLATAAFVWGNLFSEYGTYDDPVVSAVAAIVLLALAVTLGTWLPVRRWRRGIGRATE
jgi:hypothetical protein